MEQEQQQEIENVCYGRFAVAGAGLRQKENLKVKAGDRVELQIEKGNPKSTTAIAVVTTRGAQLGYVPGQLDEDRCDSKEEVFSALQAGHHYCASVTGIFDGEVGQVPIVEVEFFEAGSGQRGLTIPRTRRFKEPNADPLIVRLIKRVVEIVSIIFLLAAGSIFYSLWSNGHIGFGL